MKPKPIEELPSEKEAILFYPQQKAWIQGSVRRYKDYKGKDAVEYNPIVLASHGCGCCGEDNEAPTHFIDIPEEPIMYMVIIENGKGMMWGDPIYAENKDEAIQISRENHPIVPINFRRRLYFCKLKQEIHDIERRVT